MNITIDQVQAYAQIALVLEGIGLSAAAGIKALLKQFHGDTMTDEQMNAICDLVVADATRRKAMADSESA